ncbi:MAG: hypothetical protein IKD10_03270 [Lentisphaeria bacterium]|nr:hypothetical protein [Lentisphaeria bacterium]
MSFRIGIWDHCRYVVNREKPYDEIARHLERMRKAGVTLADIYLPEVPSLDDYCRAAANCGMQVEVRITPEWAGKGVIKRTLPEDLWADMEKKYGIRLSGPCGNHPGNRALFVEGAENLIKIYKDRLAAFHLDFIRNDNALLLKDYPCQCEECQKLNERFFGVKILTPEMLANPAIAYKVVALRNENVTRTVREMRRISCENNLKLTIAARANYIDSADITAPPVWGLGPAVLEGQDWVQWLENDYIDEAFPMNYHTELDKFRSLVSDYLRLLGDQAFSALHIGVGVISSMGENPPEAVAERLQILKNAGLPGAMLFNKINTYTDEYCQVIKEIAE